MRLWRSQVAHRSDKAGVPGSNPGSLIRGKTLKSNLEEVLRLNFLLKGLKRKFLIG